MKVYDTKPKEFKTAAEVAACYLVIDNQLLLLEGSPSKLESGKWGVPAGKLEENESPKQGEFQEEVGMAFASMALWDNRVAITQSIDASGLPYLFHQIGLIYVVEGVSCIPINKIELTYEWLQANELTKNELSPFALQALHEVKS